MTDLRLYRMQLGLTQGELAGLLSVPRNSLRMWDSGVRQTPRAVLDKASVAATEAVKDRQPLTLPNLATQLNVHLRTLQAAARTGRLVVQYSERSVFGRPRRLSTLAAGKAFLRTYYKRYGGQPIGRFAVPACVPRGCGRHLRTLRRRLKISHFPREHSRCGSRPLCVKLFPRRVLAAHGGARRNHARQTLPSHFVADAHV